MMIHTLGISFPDHIFNGYDDETRKKILEAIEIIKDPKMPLLERSIYEDFLYKHARMETPKPPMDKKERKRLARQKRREKKLALNKPPMVIATREGDGPINVTNTETGETKTLEPVVTTDYTPLEQWFPGVKGGVLLSTIINPETDVYRKEKKTKNDEGKTVVETRWLLRRDAVRKIAEAAGLKSSKVVVFAPSIDNNYLTAFDVTVTDPLGKTTTMLGEASNENTRGISKMYKALTAERRGYVRAILAHLGLKGIYGEDEFIEEDDIDVEEDKMPTKEEFEKIAPLVNRILNAESKTALQEIGEEIKGEVETLTEKQMNYLRELYKKNIAKFEGI